ncbi:MAG: hypothetical protein GY866_41270, partial [Proteobacteria bacterium]|nr:hypothetical protein [Pseudomonadota bacterium]
MNRKRNWVIEPLVPEEIYTDRTEFIDYFYNAALRAITRRTMSTVLLGQRRMGKTEIFKRVVNRLFFEQDHEDRSAAIPVYYIFPDETAGGKEFAIGYIANFIRWYAAFRLNDKSVLSTPRNIPKLIQLVQERMDISEGFSIALDLIDAIMDDGVVFPEREAVGLPREVAAVDDETIVVFLDEFQNTHL